MIAADAGAAGRSRDREIARPHAATISYRFALAALTSLACWLVAPAFDPGHIINLDAPRHLLRTIVMTTQFLPSGHVDGWSPWWYLGAQLFLFQSYGYFFLVGATAFVLTHLHLATIEQVFKVWYVLPFVVLPASAAYLARRLGVDRRGALVAALASILFSSPLGYGLYGMFGIGLLLQGAGVIGFALAWPELLGVLLERDRAPWRAVLVVAAVLVCHFITGAYMLAAAGGVAAGLAITTRSVRPLVRYALVAGVVLLLAAHSLFPSLELRDMAGQSVGWGADRDRLDRLVEGTLFGARYLALPAVLAAAWTALRGGTSLTPRGDAGTALRVSAIVFFATGLVGGANEQPWMPGPIEHLISVLLRPRALPYAALLQAVFAGLAWQIFFGWIDIAASRVRGARLPIVATPLVLAGLLAFGWHDLMDQRHLVRTESHLHNRNRRVYVVLSNWLRGHVRPPAMLAVARTLLPQSALGARSVVSLLNVDTGLYTLSGDQAELTKSTRRTAHVDIDTLDHNSDRNAAVLRAAGVSYVLVNRPGVRKRLVGNKDFQLAFEFDQVSHPRKEKADLGKVAEPVGVGVYRVRGGGVWLHGTGLKVRGMRYEPEHLSWNVEVAQGRERSPATAAVNWHPNWQASADGTPLPTHVSPARRVAFEVPAGAQTVSLDFVRSPREKLWNWLSLLTFAGVAAAWMRNARRRRRERPDGRSAA